MNRRAAQVPEAFAAQNRQSLTPGAGAAVKPSPGKPAVGGAEPGPVGLLAHFFAPRSIAVIGASPQEGSVGRALVENLRDFQDPVFPVNPKYPSVLGRPAFAQIADVPARVDLALIATPAQTVPGIVRDCVRAGVKAAVIQSAGFKERGAEGAKLEREILQVARQGGLRILGPNSLGLMVPRRMLNASFSKNLARVGSVAFISQSGALCTAVLDWSVQENVGFSAFVSVGSMLDVSWGELITSLGDDPHTRSIIIYMESIGDARSFLSAAREVAFTKPIIVVKTGRTEAGARAAASHTGAFTGSDAVIDAAFRRAGVLRVDTIQDLFDVAEVIGKQPRPRGRRLGIVTNAGGPAALAVDRLVAGGGEIAPLSEQALAELDRALPAHWSHGNPVDVLGDADPERYAKAVDIVAGDPGTDGVLVILTPQAMTDPLGTANRVKAFAAANHVKPVLASWMGGSSIESGEAVLNASSIPTYTYPERAAQAFNYLWRYNANLTGLYETPTVVARGKPGAVSHQRARALIRAARQHRRASLTLREAKEILAAYEIPVVPEFVAATEEEAAGIATKIGFPVVLKPRPESITPENGAGAVSLKVHDTPGVRQAWRSIRRGGGGRTGASNFAGVTVTRVMPVEGYEVTLGSRIDPQFGPVLLFGAGGRSVEGAQDRAIGFPPLTSTLARRLMEQTRIYAALKGNPGHALIDLTALEHLLVRFSQLVAEQRWIKEVDVNPLLVSPGEIVALDARIALHEPGVVESDLPSLAIRPYPEHYTKAYTLRDRTQILVRAIRPEDEPMMVNFHATLSDQSVYYRYFTAMSLKQRTGHARLARLCFIDYDRELALVALHDDPVSGETALLGVGRLCKAHGRNEAEFAVVISDRWHHRGLGTLLLKRLVEVGRAEHLGRITGTVLAENHAMRRVCDRLGFTLRHRPAEQEFEATIAP